MKRQIKLQTSTPNLHEIQIQNLLTICNSNQVKPKIYTLNKVFQVNELTKKVVEIEIIDYISDDDRESDSSEQEIEDDPWS